MSDGISLSLVTFQNKYRFLPFADKREMELIWNGKNNEINSIGREEAYIELRSASTQESDYFVRQGIEEGLQLIESATSSWLKPSYSPRTFCERNLT